ncbi:MAG: response regulator [Pirellulaceae bacterium]|nr:response regulator [Pirellulaceae bacterium]
MERLAKDSGLAGLFVARGPHDDAMRVERLLENERILEGMPDGVALLDAENTIVWANQAFRNWCVSPEVTGRNFYATLGNPEILGPDFCPFHTSLATRQASSSTLRVDENRYFHIHAAPVCERDKQPQHLIITVRDVTAEKLQQQKMAAIHKAGIELADLSPEEIFNMEIEDRIELLKSNILHYTQDLLKFDVIEIRLLDSESGQLEPLLSVGIDSEAANRNLYARTQDNGVTGFVAATGKSYLCEDTTEDPLYIQGLAGAKSSLTVPLVWHDQVIGTFNVESPEPRAFTESDLQFLEIFSRDVAVSLNTLELLVAQKANTAKESVEAIHSAVALPVDEILNDAVNVMERYIGHEPEVVERLQRILRNARDIRKVIQKVGQRMAPVRAVPQGSQVEERPKLRNCRLLVVDADETVRGHAHDLLERYHCIVETAHDGGEATYMVRNCEQYDVVISDIRLPDMTGYDLMVKLKETMRRVPLVLMSGFGYDPTHTIVKARKAGLLPNAVLYKPFRLDQLLATVESILDHHAQAEDDDEEE